MNKSSIELVDEIDCDIEATFDVMEKEMQKAALRWQVIQQKLILVAMRAKLSDKPKVNNDIAGVSRKMNDLLLQFKNVMLGNALVFSGSVKQLKDSAIPVDPNWRNQLILQPTLIPPTVISSVFDKYPVKQALSQGVGNNTPATEHLGSLSTPREDESVLTQLGNDVAKTNTSQVREAKTFVGQIDLITKTTAVTPTTQLLFGKHNLRVHEGCTHIIPIYRFKPDSIGSPAYIRVYNGVGNDIVQVSYTDKSIFPKYQVLKQGISVLTSTSKLHKKDKTYTTIKLLQGDVLQIKINPTNIKNKVAPILRVETLRTCMYMFVASRGSVSEAMDKYKRNYLLNYDLSLPQLIASVDPDLSSRVVTSYDAEEMRGETIKPKIEVPQPDTASFAPTTSEVMVIDDDE